MSKVIFTHGSFFIGNEDVDGTLKDLTMLVPAGEGRVAWVPAGMGFSEGTWTMTASGAMTSDASPEATKQLEEMIGKQRAAESGIVLPQGGSFQGAPLRTVK